LLLLGIVLGHVWVGVSAHWHDVTDNLAQNLPPEKQQIFTTAMQHMKQNTDNLCKQIVASRDVAAKLLITEPFDRSAYLAQTKYIRGLRAQMLEQRATTIADLGAQFNAAERSVLVDLIYRLHSPTCQSERPKS